MAQLGSNRGVMARRLNAAVGISDDAPIQTARCSLPGCGGHLQFHTDELGRLLHACPTCEERRARAARLERIRQRQEVEVRYQAAIAEVRRPLRSVPPKRPPLPEGTRVRPCKVCRVDVESRGRGRPSEYCGQHEPRSTRYKRKTRAREVARG